MSNKSKNFTQPNTVPIMLENFSREEQGYPDDFLQT